MKKPLGSKRENALAPIGRKLIEKGYAPGFFANGKDHPGKGWPTREYSPTAGGSTLCIRMLDNKGLAGLDSDITDDALCSAASKLIQAKLPALCQAPHRHSGGLKYMLFMRCVTDGRRLMSRAWVREEGAETQRLEFFTSNDSRYVCTHGKHSEGRVYGWEEGRALEDVAFADLPEVTYEEVSALIEEFDRLAESMGFIKKAESLKGQGEPLYDLLPGMEIVTIDGDRMTLADLEQIAPGHGKWIKCYATPWAPESITADRCKANIGPYGLEIWDFKDERMHYWASAKPADLTVLAELMRKLKDDVGGAKNEFFDTDLPEGVRLEDFRAYMPKHMYIYMPLGELWPQASIDSRLPWIPVYDAAGNRRMKNVGKENEEPKDQKPSSWLDKNAPVEQMIWAPGHPPIIEGVLLSDGGWTPRPGTAAFNRYRPAIWVRGDARRAGRWLDLLEAVYSDHDGHIVEWFAHCIQRPDVKINHGLVWIGQPGIGKDTLIEPLKFGVGPWNFREISPHDIVGTWNDYMDACVVRVSEARDLGDINRYMLYEKMKVLLASPPDVLRINPKYGMIHNSLNVSNFIITSNHMHDGLYLPENDRRHYVCGTDATQEKIGDEAFWLELWAWYRDGGLNDVITYLAGYDISSFNPKAPPEKTEAFWRLVGAAVAPEVTELDDLFTSLDQPAAVTLSMLISEAKGEIGKWLSDRANRRTLPHRLESCGYIAVRNPGAKHGLWEVAGKRQAIYGRLADDAQSRVDAAAAFVRSEAAKAEAFRKKLAAQANKAKK